MYDEKKQVLFNDLFLNGVNNKMNKILNKIFYNAAWLNQQLQYMQVLNRNGLGHVGK